jgi:serine phosphatase RsbU (regulator of sigma subunit)
VQTHKHVIKYTNGKQTIGLIVNVIVLIGFLLEFITYHKIYSPLHYSLQIISSFVLVYTLAQHFRDKQKYFVTNFLIISYCVILNILLSVILFQDFFEKIAFSRSDFFSRDMFFILAFIAFVGFIAGNIHVVIQGVLLLFFLSYELIFAQDAFILDSAPLYYLTSIGFCWVMYFLVNILNNFLNDLNQSNSEINQLQLIAQNKQNKLQEYNIAIIKLSEKNEFDKTEVHKNTKAFEAIVKTVADNIDCSRVSIWLFSADKNSIQKKILYQGGSFDHSSAELHSSDFPIYFNSILNTPYLAASNALTNKNTKEFIVSYLEPLNVFSMLDCPIKLNNEVIGVLCCENQGSIKVWEEEDILFAQSVSDFVAIQLKDIEIQSLLSSLKIKNKEILDSINYAKRLQSAILPPSKLVEKYLINSFIVYKPKDIVAGDFYWMEVIDDHIIFALADCTGHGVPGALVSVVCHNALNNAVRDQKLLDPGKILDKTREFVIEQFDKSEENVSDGMDISLCIYNKKENTLKWAGANSPLLLLSENKITKIRPNKQPVGKFNDLKPFTTHTLHIQKNDVVYLFSDGYIDQFGGAKQKKLKYKKLTELILSASSIELTDQKHFFEEEFENWKGANEQVDDVCMIGVKFD